MADKTVRGQFVWHELMTPDTAGAHAFYSKALGWKTQAWEQDPSYSMFASARGPLGGSVAQPDGAPHWLHYVGTPDIDASVRQAGELGASVVQEVTTLSHGGRYAVLTDPQGARFALYSAAEPEPARHAPPGRGDFSWHELATTDCEAALDFYAALFGWEKMAAHDMGPMGTYLIFGLDGRQLGGMFNKPAEVPNAHWLGYVRVKDVRQTVDKVKSARGRLINGPMEVPGGDWIAQLVDPYGAMFAVHATAADMKTAEPEAAPAPARSTVAKPAKKPARKAAAGGKKAAAKKAGAKKAAPRKASAGKARRKKAAGKKPSRKAGARKKTTKKSAARTGRSATRKAGVAKKGGKKKSAAKGRSGGARRTARRPRKAK